MHVYEALTASVTGCVCEHVVAGLGPAGAVNASVVVMFLTVTLPVFFTVIVYEVFCPTVDTVVVDGVLVTDSDGPAVAVTVAVDGADDTEVPAGD